MRVHWAARSLSVLMHVHAWFALRPLALEPPGFARSLRAAWTHTAQPILPICSHIALPAADGQTAVTAAAKVPVVDTIGAGDLFTSGCLYGLLSGASLKVRPSAGNPY